MLTARRNARSQARRPQLCGRPGPKSEAGSPEPEVRGLPVSRSVRLNRSVNLRFAIRDTRSAIVRFRVSAFASRDFAARAP